MSEEVSGVGCSCADAHWHGEGTIVFYTIVLRPSHTGYREARSLFAVRNQLQVVRSIILSLSLWSAQWPHTRAFHVSGPWFFRRKLVLEVSHPEGQTQEQCNGEHFPIFEVLRAGGLSEVVWKGWSSKEGRKEVTVEESVGHLVSSWWKHLFIRERPRVCLWPSDSLKVSLPHFDYLKIFFSFFDYGLYIGDIV